MPDEWDLENHVNRKHKAAISGSRGTGENRTRESERRPETNPEVGRGPGKLLLLPSPGLPWQKKPNAGPGQCGAGKQS